MNFLFSLKYVDSLQRYSLNSIQNDLLPLNLFGSQCLDFLLETISFAIDFVFKEKCDIGSTGRKWSVMNAH